MSKQESALKRIGLSAVPDGWELSHLAKVVAEEKPIVYGIVQAGPHVEGGVPYIKSADVARPLVLDKLQRTSKEIAAQYKRAEVKTGDIAFSLRGNIGESQIIPGEVDGANLTQGTARISVNGQNVNVFVRYALNSSLTRRQIHAYGKGSTFKEISLEQLRKLIVLLPSLSEQKKIASILSTWDRAIGLIEKLIAAKKKRKQALMQQLLTGKVRFPGFGNAPWQEKQLGSLLCTRNEQLKNDGTYPLYSLTIEDGVTPKSERYDREFLVRDKTTKKYKSVHPGDIVFNPSNLRWGAIGMHNDTKPVLVSPIYEVLQVSDEEKTDRSFLFQQLSSPRQIKLFACMAEGTLVERTAVKLPVFKICKVLMPPTRMEQSRIAEVLNLADEEIRCLISRRNALTRQKAGLMQQLLTGKKRVEATCNE